MTIINFLEVKNKIKLEKKEDNNEELIKKIDREFHQELKDEKLVVLKISSINNSKKLKREELDKLKILEKKYFLLSSKIGDKLDLLRYMAMLDKEYNTRYIFFINEHIEDIVSMHRIEEIIKSLKFLKQKTLEEEIESNYIIGILEGKKVHEEKDQASYKNIKKMFL